MAKSKQKTVMVFGTFDGLHEGHRAMLQEAKSFGNFLIAVVAQDHIVEHLKGHLPKKNLAERFEHLTEADGVDRVAIGDAEKSVWNVISRYNPDIIAIGHDQDALESDLKAYIKKNKIKTIVEKLKYFEVSKE